MNLQLLRFGLAAVLALDVDSAGTVFADEAFRDPQHFAYSEMTDKYPSIAVDTEGEKWIVWAGMSRIDLTDGIYLRNANKKKGERVQVSAVLGIETTPVLLAGPGNSLYVVWAAKRNANWDIFLRQRVAGEWGDEIRVTTDSANDENPRADITSDGTLVLVWESNRDGNYKILAKELSAEGWSETVTVSDNECDNHRPALALASSDRWWVAWDCAVSANYDIYVRSFKNGKWSDTERVTVDDGVDDSAALAIEPDSGNLWLVWNSNRDSKSSEKEKSRAYRRPVLRALLERASAPQREVAAASEGAAVIDTSADGLQVFFGDIHAHSSLTDGKYGRPDQMYVLARERFKLDFFAMTDHADFDRLTPSQWAQAQDTASYFNRPGDFITFSGFEWNPPEIGSDALEGGHRCVIYPTDDQPIFAGDRTVSDSIPKLYRAIEKTNGVVIGHHTAHAHWGRWDPENYAPLIEPVMEITSTHGRFEYYGNPRNSKARPQVPGHSYQDALARGYRLGAVGGSDTHHMRPGYMGMTAVWAPELTRADIFQAIRERRTYAITGDRIRLLFRMDGHEMGSEYRSLTPPSIDVDVAAPSAIESIDIIKNNVAIHTVVRNADFADGASTYLEYDQAEPQGIVIRRDESPHRLTIEFVDSFFEPTAADNYYYVRVTLANGHQAWSSPIWVSGSGLD